MDSFSDAYNGATDTIEHPNGTRAVARTVKPKVHLDPASGPDLHAELVGLLEDLHLEAQEARGAARLRIVNRIKLVQDFAAELASFHDIETD